MDSTHFDIIIQDGNGGKGKLRRTEAKNQKKTYGQAMLPRPYAFFFIFLFEIKQLKISLFYKNYRIYSGILGNVKELFINYYFFLNRVILQRPS